MFAISVAGIHSFDPGASRFFAFEEPVHFCVVLLAVDLRAFGFVVTEEELCHICTVPQAAVEETSEGGALRTIVAVEFIHLGVIRGRTRDGVHRRAVLENNVRAVSADDNMNLGTES